MQTTKTRYVDDINEALAICASDMYDQEISQVAVLGGHYMLMYDQRQDKLEPVIWQEHAEEQTIQFSKMMSGDFPLLTFNLAIQLRTILQENDILVRLLLVINDHKFQARNFQPGILDIIRHRGGELRKKFYQHGNLPVSFLNTLTKYALTADDFFLDNSDLNRTENATLPQKTCFFSEQVLQRSFERHTYTKMVSQVNNFLDKRSNDVFIYSPALREEICLIENGICGCTGQIIELIGQVFARNIFGMILMVPDECAEAVNIGIVVAQEFYKRVSLILCIHNLGGMGRSTIEINQLANIRIDAHSYTNAHD